MNNKDLIEDIKAKLKEAQEHPYREGAWERFAAQQGRAKDRKIIVFKRLASIAAAGLAVLSVSLYLYNSRQNDLPTETQLAQSPQTSLNNNSSLNSQNNSTNITQGQDKKHTSSQADFIATSSQAVESAASIYSIASITEVEEIDKLELIGSEIETYELANLPEVQPKIANHQERVTEFDAPLIINPQITSLAHQTAHNILSNNAADKIAKSQNMALGDKFQLGLFVSPNRTSDKYDVGAGFLVSYALSKKVSLRVGTSYNSYSVGVMKDPMETASAERVSMESNHANNSIVAGDKSSIAFTQQMVLPNINAVMGKVEALEIPLDVAYQFNKGFYTSAGVSYSAIINQKREAQYIENGGIMSFQDKATLIPEAAQSLNKVQVKTVKSLEENVNPNGFSGFANFSIGKKVDIKNKLSISLEPYVKVPLGQFRKSDLDYTNSGIRIITTF